MPFSKQCRDDIYLTSVCKQSDCPLYQCSVYCWFSFYNYKLFIAKLTIEHKIKILVMESIIKDSITLHSRPTLHCEVIQLFYLLCGPALGDHIMRYILSVGLSICDPCQMLTRIQNTIRRSTFQGRLPTWGLAEQLLGDKVKGQGHWGSNMKLVFGTY